MPRNTWKRSDEIVVHLGPEQLSPLGEHIMNSIFLPTNVQPPQEVLEAMDFIQHKIANYKGEFSVDPNDANWHIFVFQHNDEWGISSNYEDGFQGTIFRDKNWYFRDPWDGTDSLIRDDGIFQAIARHWLSYYVR